MTMPIGLLDKRLVVAVSIVAICAVVAVIMFFSGNPDVTDGTPEQRVEAVVRLAGERSRGAKKALLTATRDASPRVRRTALVGLSHMLDAKEVRPAIEKAIKDEDAGVRAIAPTRSVTSGTSPSRSAENSAGTPRLSDSTTVPPIAT